MKSDVNFYGDRGVSPKDFRHACCEHFNCPAGEYEHTVLLNCLHSEKTITAKVLLRVMPFYFDWDIELIRVVAKATSVAELKEELNHFRYHFPLTGVLHRRLRLRVSGLEMISLAHHVFGEKRARRERPGIVLPELVNA